MGKNTDKLYITHSEWASSDAFSASAGSAAGRAKGPNGATFKRLPYNFCALTLQPFSHPVCTANGTIFELTAIVPWLKKHGMNPVDGTSLKAGDLIKLTLAKNEEGEYVDPVTFKQFTDNTHIIALRNTGNVFAYDTVERLNIKAKNLRDLVSDIEFSRKDIITLQDPQNLQSRDLSSFKYIQEGTSTLTDEELAKRADPTNNLNLTAMGSSAKVLKAREAVARARAERAGNMNSNNSPASSKTLSTPSSTSTLPKNISTTKPAAPYNAANHTTGLAAASFTSTGVTPHTLATRALLTNEDYLLKPRRVKNKGYVRLSTTHGDLALELNTEHAPRAVWNFINLAKKGYYDNVNFHRNIRNFMLQGGDPTGTGKGGSSIWNQPFIDEFAQSPLKHSARGVLSMANKGKNTNTSQFFITYRPAPHLDRKHTIFGKVIPEDAESMETLRRLEEVETDEGDRPRGDVRIQSVFVFVDPFEEFMKEQDKEERVKKEEEEAAREDDVVTWTGKRIRKDGGVGNDGGGGSVGVGKYLDAAAASRGQEADEIVEVVEEWATEEPPPAKKRKGGGFGDFSGW